MDSENWKKKLRDRRKLNECNKVRHENTITLKKLNDYEYSFK